MGILWIWARKLIEAKGRKEGRKGLKHYKKLIKLNSMV
jgi:hypothetical protein